MKENDGLHDKLMKYKADIAVLESNIQLHEILCYILVSVLIILFIYMLMPIIKKRVFDIRRGICMLVLRAYTGFRIKNQRLKSKILRLENRDKIVISIVIGVTLSLLLGVICGEKEYYSYYENKRISKERDMSIDATATYSKFNLSYILVICGLPFFSGITYLAIKQRKTEGKNE
ncbi:hypothetical protein [Elizabethkingia meningoseptica]|uniref:hypothetical protein n=1 Tax=Elizabethkingia meningoseptica TaxID=238 RepID=UPI000841FF57|nr:hypothetical protein [Elizabethkingia meningoseptica]ODM55188.1 hypothetical protein BES09_01670 [Elizabethkingia meningoseptica]OHT30393.1 hypothetical protein BFF93_01675 [Elizabethkingia meningoseptica]OPC12129.1 hypothetical protein BAX93_06460 [Elizabethkingia meningoseptica]